MPDELVQRFIDALGRLESDRDVDPMVELYSGDSDVGNVALTRTFDGPDGARDFWTSYRDAFDEVESTFRTTYEADGQATLEWRTRARLQGSGEEIEYDGVSLLEHADGRLTRFRAYFDPRPITRETAASGAA